MKKEVSYEGIGGVAATFLAGEGVERGAVVGLTGPDTVGPCADGARFCGVAADRSGDGFACVQVRGFVQASYSGEGVVPGWVDLAADGAGGVKKAAGGASHLVVQVDEASRTAVLLL